MVRNGHNVSICIWYEMVIMYRSAYGTKWLWYENDFHYGTKWQVRNDCNSWGMGAEEFRRAPMMYQKVPTLGRTNYTINLNTCEILLRDKKKTEVLPVTTSK